MVRPKFSSNRLGSEKAVFCIDRDDLIQKFPEWPAKQEALIIQKKVGGIRYNLYFTADRGDIVCSHEAVIVRTDRLNGTGLAVFGYAKASSETLLDYSGRLVKAIHYSGVGAVQFLVEREAGKVWFLELNPRIAGSNAVLEAVGLEASRYAVDLAVGGQHLDPIMVNCPGAGIRSFAWVVGDLSGLKRAVGRRQVGAKQILVWGSRIVKSALNADIHLMWRWDDPYPVLLSVLAKWTPRLEKLMKYLVLKDKTCPVALHRADN